MRVQVPQAGNDEFPGGVDNFGASRNLYWLMGYRSDAITSYHNRLVAK